MQRLRILKLLFLFTRIYSNYWCTCVHLALRLRLILVIPAFPHRCLYDVFRNKYTFFTVIFTDINYKKPYALLPTQKQMRCKLNRENWNLRKPNLNLCIFFLLPGVPIWSGCRALLTAGEMHDVTARLAVKLLYERLWRRVQYFNHWAWNCYVTVLHLRNWSHSIRNLNQTKLSLRKLRKLLLFTETEDSVPYLR